MLRVTVRARGLLPVILGSGERLLLGRAPHDALPAGDLAVTALALPGAAPHVSRLLAELTVGEELARLHLRGGSEAQLSSLFDAPAGARRVTLVDGMAALLDEGENSLLLLRGREVESGYADLTVAIDVEQTDALPAGPLVPSVPTERGGPAATSGAPGLLAGSREWYVALALAEPWLTGTDDYPRPPSNREIYERVREWHGYAWNLERSQRVDDAIRAVAGVAFGAADDPLRGPGRQQNLRFAVGRRIAETRLVTAEDLRRVLQRGDHRGGGDKAEPSTP